MQTVDTQFIHSIHVQQLQNVDIFTKCGHTNVYTMYMYNKYKLWTLMQTVDTQFIHLAHVQQAQNVDTITKCGHTIHYVHVQ